MAHFKVPDCFLPTAVAPGDVILQAKERDAGEGGQDGGRLVQFFCHAGILYHNSGYFKALLSGAWRENELKILFVQDDKDGKDTTHGTSDTRHSGSNMTATLFDATKSKMLVIRATISFEDEAPETIYQLLAFLYPHLSLTLTKENWGPVMRLADKICLTGLSGVVDEYMREEILHVDPLSVLLWAYENKKKDLFRKCSTIVLDRMASGEINSLEILPQSLQIQLANKRFELVRELLQFISQIDQLAIEYGGSWDWWSTLAKEASSSPSSASAVKLVAGVLKSGQTDVAKRTAKKFEQTLTRQWCLELDIPNDEGGASEADEDEDD